MKESMQSLSLPKDKAQRKSISALGAFGNLLFWAALFTVPLVMHPALYHPYTALKYLFLGFFAILLFPLVSVLILSGKIPAHRIARTFPLFLLVWIVLHFVSSLLARNRIFAQEQTGFTVACALFSFWAFVHAGKSRLLEAGIWLLGIVAFLGAVYGYAQFTGTDLLELEEPGKPVAFWGNANFAAQFLIAILPLLLVPIMTSRFRVFFLSVSVLVFMQILLLKSRGGILGCAVGLLFFFRGLFYLGKFGWGEKRCFINFTPTVLIILILGIGVTGGTFLFLDQGEIVKEMMSSFSPAPESNQYRLLAWKASLRLALAHPILGVGPANYRFMHPLYTSPEFWKFQGLFSNIRHVYAHNDYINILCELGVLGLGAFLGILVFLGFGLRRFMKNDAAPEQEKMYALALGSGLLATCVQSLFDFNLYNPASGFLFWIMAGFLAGMTFPISIPVKSLFSFPRILAGTILLIISLPALFLVPARLVIHYRNERLLRTAHVLFEAHRYDKAAEAAASALAKDRNNIDAAILLADSLRNTRGREEEAISAYQLWATLEPHFVPIYNSMGDSYFKLGRKAEARQVFEKALSLNPHSVPVLLNLGNLALDAKNPALAVSYYERASKEGGKLLDQNEAQYGIALVLLKRYEDAIPHLEKGLETFPQQAPLILEFLGDCYSALGQKDKARETYVKALLFGPKPSLKQKLSH